MKRKRKKVTKTVKAEKADKLTAKEEPDAPDNRDWYKPFIMQLTEFPNVTRACAFAGVARQTAYAARDIDKPFKQAWDECIAAAIDGLEEVAFKRAKESSDLLTIFLLKAHRPGRYRETNRHEITGADGADVTVTLNIGGTSDDGDQDS